MAQQQHPAFAKEQQHLTWTLDTIAGEHQRLEGEIPEQKADVKRLHLEAGGLLSLDEEIAKSLLEYLESSYRNLELAGKRPYFTRVDFIPEGGREETHYIGKWGVLKSPEMSSVVVDWRSPIANLYYAGQLGPVDYKAPDGQVRGELTLKRQLDVQEGKLLRAFDLDIVSQDEYLQQALSQVSGDRLKEIVSTIQAEQNIVIRHSPDLPLVVQGVAGSGKTSIALHRVAWLLYAYQKQMRPRQMLILAPSPLFLDYISQVLPELGVEQVPQTTLSDFFLRQLEQTQLRVKARHSLESLLALPEARRQEITRRMQFMGSLDFRRIVVEYIEWLKTDMLPPGDIKFGPVTLLTEQQVREIFLGELAHFPLERRVKEFAKYIKVRLVRAAAQVEAWLQKTCEERVQALLESLPDGPERQRRVKKLYDSRDARIEESRKTQKTFVADTLETFRKLPLLPTYLSMFDHEPGLPMTAEQRADWAACREARGEITRLTVRPEDLPPLLLLRRAIQGLPRVDIRHLVVDEAQDISVFSYHMIYEIMNNPSVTIVGDLMQGIHTYSGLASWQDLIDGVYGGQASMKYLVTSYRNTVEIMSYAMRVAARHAVPGQQTAQPVLRHGPQPELLPFAGERDRNQFLIDKIRALKADGFTTIAVIAHDWPSCKKLASALPADLGAHLLQEMETHYEAGVLVLPASMVKGLEFDCVLVADCSADVWPDQPLSARLLYVCLTRPLHRLYCCYVGQRTALLPDVEKSEDFSPMG